MITMWNLEWLIQPSLILILSFGVHLSEGLSDDNIPINVTWTTIPSRTEMAQKVNFGDLHGTTIEEMFSHYKKKNDEEVKQSVRDGFLLRGTPGLQYSVDHRKDEVLKKFVHHTINAVANNYNTSDCGVTAINGTLHLNYCPGLMTIVTLNHIGVYSCSSIKSLSVYGPVIIKSGSCSEQILSKGDCELAMQHSFLDGDCHIVKKEISNNHYLVAFVLLIFLNILAITSLVLFTIRFRKLREVYNSKAKLTGMELYNFSVYDSERGTTTTKDCEESESLVTVNKKRLSWCHIIIVLLCCRPIGVEPYELLTSQKVGSSLYKYTLILASSETIKIGPQTISLSNPDTTSRLVHMFTSYDWDIEFENKYYCLQSGCNDNLTCREDILPFVRSDELINSEFPHFKGRPSFYTCKNMFNYCAFASGCFIMAFSLKLDEHKRYEVYKISQQHRISKDVHLPPGCYLDEYIPDRTSGVDEMYFVENHNGVGWFCHPTIYSHYPLPHSLGDLKVGVNNTINFISDFMDCATDRWRDVHCTKPSSFLSHLDDYCVKNSPIDLGMTITRQEDSLSWPSDKIETIKISCDRDLQLIQSDHHCTDVQVEVWDTGNVQSDLLMSVFAKSESGIGVFVLPDRVHAESHHFGCNGVWHNTFLYDLKSLNSSGIPFKFHTNTKPIISDDYTGEETRPINEDHWYNTKWGNWFSSIKEWLTGFSGTTLVIIIVIVLIILRR